MPNITEANRIKPHRAAGLRVTCPHCDTPAVTRTSDRLSPLLREIYYQCTNVFCGHAFVATLEIVRTVTPSTAPRAGIRLPMLVRGNHKPVFPPDPPQPANDDASPAIGHPDTG
jgi:hypothetical protein